MLKVDREVAEKEIDGWLDKKNVMASVRTNNEENRDLLIDAVCDGVLTIDDDYRITHKLLVPFGDEETINSFTYRLRLNDKILQPFLKGIKSNDADGRFTAHLAALVDQPVSVIKLMDSVDKKIAMAIAVFFL